MTTVRKSVKLDTSAHVSQGRLALLQAISHLRRAAAQATKHKRRLESKVKHLRKLFDSLEPFMAHRAAKRKTPAKPIAVPKRKPAHKSARKPKPVTKKMTVKSTRPARPKALTESTAERIISKALKLGGTRVGYNDVRLAPLRAAVPDISRAEFDATLRQLLDAGHIALYREDNTAALTEADKKAVFVLAPMAERHLMYVLQTGMQLVDPQWKAAQVGR